MGTQLCENLMNDSKLYFPDWIYNPLPYLYVSVGLYCVFSLPSAVGIFSGVTLMSAGAAIGMLRHRHRQVSHHAQRRAGDVPVRPIFEIAWRDRLATGHRVLDEEHRRLFDLANNAINAVLNNQSTQTVNRLLEELIEHIVDHFCTEEATLAGLRHPQYAAHKEIHQSLLAKAFRLRDGLPSGGEPVARELVSFVAFDVLTDHILKEDQKFWSTTGEQSP